LREAVKLKGESEFKSKVKRKSELLEKYKDYDPLNDALFSKYMASKGCEKQFLSFINAILKCHGEEKVNSIEIIDNKVLYPVIDGQKTCILDLRSVTDEGVKIIAELQDKDQYFFEKRSTAYLCGEIFKSGEKGEIKNLKNHILINILNFKYCKKHGEYNAKL